MDDMEKETKGPNMTDTGNKARSYATYVPALEEGEQYSTMDACVKKYGSGMLVVHHEILDDMDELKWKFEKAISALRLYAKDQDVRILSGTRARATLAELGIKETP